MSEQNPYRDLGPKKSLRQEILDEAMRIVSTDRANTYGQPEDNFARIAALWNVYLQDRRQGRDAPLEPHDIANLMILMKVARLMNTPVHKDSLIDIAGYAAAGYQAGMAGTHAKT